MNKKMMLLAVSLIILGAGLSIAENSPQSDFFTVNGVKIHYFVQGSGVPVVLIHAWLSSAKSIWVKPGTMDQLVKANHRVVALDLSGYGDSDSPDDPKAYGDAWVEQVLQLMDHLHIPRAHIVGYSMGSMVALKFIVLHPDRSISGLLGGMGYLEENSENQKKWEGRPRAKSSGAAQLALTPEQVKSVQVPVELVVGGRDPTRKSYIEPLLKVRHDWPVVIIPGKGHLATVGAQEFKDAIVQWVDQHSS